MAERKIDRVSFEWLLASDSLVIEVGGFKGRWASEIVRRYGCRVHVFEPQDWAAEKAGEELRRTGLSDWEVHGYGLSTRADAGTQEMGAWGTDGCSIMRDAAYMETYEGSRNKTGTGQFRAALPVLRAFPEIDLMLMNIEGYEYRLLPELIEGGVLDHIRLLAVQFHETYEAEGEYEAICEAIERTHRDLGAGLGRPLRTWERR